MYESHLSPSLEWIHLQIYVAICGKHAAGFLAYETFSIKGSHSGSESFQVQRAMILSCLIKMIERRMF